MVNMNQRSAISYKQCLRLWGFLAVILITPLLASGQSKDIRKANKLYQVRAYHEAIPLYESALSKDFRIGTAQRLAECYRLTNRWKSAEALLDSLVLMDRVREEMWFLYGEALMSNGRYNSAREWFLRYAAAVPEDSLALQRAEACLIIEQIPPLFGTVDYRALPINSSGDDHAAIPTAEGLLFTSDRSPGARFLKEKSAWTGRDYLGLWISQPIGDSLWSEPEPYSGRLNALNSHVGYAVFTADSSRIYFTRNAPESNKRGLYPLQIYTAEHAGVGRWSRPELVSFANPEMNMMHPALSPDGRLLVYASDRGRGKGGLDLWLVVRQGETWSRPQLFPDPINTSGNEGFPFFAADGRLFFASQGHPGFGGYDLFMTQRTSDGSWTPPRNLGPPLNSPLDDITFTLLAAGNGGYFSSTRDGQDDDLYQWWLTTEPIVPDDSDPPPVQGTQMDRERGW